MWVEELPNGKFKFVERYLDEKTGKNKKVSVTLTTKSPQAEKKAFQILTKKINQNKTKQAKEITLGQAVSEYIEFKEKHWANATNIKNRGFYTRHIKNAPEAEYLINKLTLSDVQSLLDRVQYDKGISGFTAVSIKSLIGKSIGYAMDEYGVECNLKLSKIHIKPNENEKKRYIESSEIPDLLKKIRSNINEVYADAIEVQLLTGMRIGELRALTKEDWEDGKIHITKSIERMSNKVSKTKNKQSVRTIETSNRIDEIISNRIKCNDILFGEESSYIFASRLNGPITYTYLASELKKVDKNLTTHMFRHTHISLLAEKGFDIKYIMDRVGHSNPDTTLKVYSHVTEKMKKEAKTKLNSLY